MTRLEHLDTETINETLSLLSKRWAEGKYFEHFNARTIREAVSLLDNYAGEAKIIAGGVDLIRLMRNKVIAPKVLVNIKTVPSLAYISEDAEGLKLGTLITIREIEKSAIIRDGYGVLAEAAHQVASPQIRNMATIGGNLCQEVNCWYYRRSPLTGTSFTCYRKGGTSCYALTGDKRYHTIIGRSECHAVSQSDMAAILIALGARIKIANLDGAAIIPLEELYTPLGNILDHREIIIEIQIPVPPLGTKHQYLKFRLRKTIDPPLASVAAAITIEAGRVTDARIVLGAVAPTPYRSLEAEEVIKGKVITESLAETAAKAAVSQAALLSMNTYKVSIIKALVRRAIVGLK